MNKLTFPVDKRATKKLRKNIKKVKQLVKLLREAQQIADSLAKEGIIRFLKH
ncbi:hypothetical protein MKC54_11130 [[Clostridium] innocuum]|nr:hypothetical protein [[Clostridium] innocuum]MCR0577439.1 hypothetical protein [[Clostridium] innocuum]